MNSAGFIIQSNQATSLFKDFNYLAGSLRIYRLADIKSSFIMIILQGKNLFYYRRVNISRIPVLLVDR